LKRSAIEITKALSVYLVMGIHGIHGQSAIQIAELALKGGVTMLQLREKNADIREILEAGKALKQLCKEHEVPFIINDRVDLAMVLGADGVHVGQTDLPANEVRRLMGPNAVIGVSAGNRFEANRAMSEGADYLGVGSIFATSTKTDAGAPVGIRWVREVRRMTNDVPIVGIGGITADNAAEVILAGANGVAVVSAILNQADPYAAAKELSQKVQQAK
jgi:thiamine-phosphate pyrophosphorylase